MTPSSSTNVNSRKQFKQKILMILRNLIRKCHYGVYQHNEGKGGGGPIAPKEMVKALQTLGSTTSSSSSSKYNSFHNHRRLFRPGRQEDAHEFLVHLLDDIHTTELLNAGINQRLSGWKDKLPIPRLDETTLIHRIFGGYFRSQVCCTKCSYKSNTYDPFLDLSLEVCSKSSNSITKAFAEFTKKEHLDRENKWKCSGCQRKVCAMKQLTVFRPPLSLCIQLKRFAYGGGGGFGYGGGFKGKKGSMSMMMGRGSSKIMKPIEFPANLKLPLSDGRTCDYVLTGAIIHVGGSATSGHYTAYVKKPSFATASSSSTKNQWYHMDDSYVDPVSEKTVLKQKDAYVLFYCRREVKLEFPSPPPRGSMTAFEAKKVGLARAKARADSITSLTSVTSFSTPDDKKNKNIKVKSSIDDNSSSNGGDDSEEEPSKKMQRLSSSSLPLGVPVNESETKDNISTSLPPKTELPNHTNNEKEGTTPASTEKNNDSIAGTASPMKTAKEQKGGGKVVLQRGTQGNIQVVLGRKQKTSAWKPSSSPNLRDNDENDLLGNINIGKWDDEDDGNDDEMKNMENSGVINQQQKSQRSFVLKEMQSKERSRKRKMYLNSWDAKLDEGKRKKVKNKESSNTLFNSQTTTTPECNPFHRIQSSMQKMNKGRAKGLGRKDNNIKKKNNREFKKSSLHGRKSKR
mmetsp:Transcript_36934/g.54087  ORF Transcript_36934/g.54087 Transcript_36934/m.54087 type:complete len:683 (-) Transcript_36934:402-2450(-)